MTHVLILCARGNEGARSRAAVAGLVNAVRHDAPGLDVVGAFVDSQEPTIHDAIAQTSGPRTVVPLTLAYDPQVGADIAHACQLDPAVTVTAPIGPDWTVAEVGVRRLFEAGARSDDTIVLAAGITDDRQAVADTSRAARLLSAVWGGRVHVGTLRGPDTPLSDAVDVARAYGRRVVISSHVLTAGAMQDQICVVGADVVTAPLLDGSPPDARLVALVRERATRPRLRTKSPSIL